MTHLYNKPSEKAKRKQLRNNMTPAEIILWSKLKDKGLGYKFRRQHGVGPFVLDFCCPTLKLAVEVDGDSHYTPEAKVRDDERQKVIEACGFRFLRFTNREVTENVEGVAVKISQYIKRLTTPPPPCQGGD